jgi:hypothetical protein
MAINQSAQDILRAFLADYGLESLASWAWSQYTASGVASIEEFTPALRAELPKQAAFKQRFPAYDAMLQANKGISVDEYVRYEKDLNKAANYYGLPAGFLDDRDYVAKIMLADVSADEFAERAQMARDNALNAPAETRQALQDLYGMSEGDLTAFWMDPDKAMPLLQRRSTAAAIAGAGLKNSIAISAAEAERLAAEDITAAKAREGFQQVAAQQGLQYGEGETVTQQDLIGSVFGDAQAAQKVERVQRSRTAEFAQGGGAAASQSGIAGLGRNS